MASFLRHIVGGGVSFRDAAIGWEAPTTVQPIYAGFFEGGDISNLASGGAASAVVGAQPALTAGVSGTNVPYITAVPGTAAFRVPATFTSGLTIISLCSVIVAAASMNTAIFSSYEASSGNVIQVRDGGTSSALHGYMTLGGGNYASCDLIDTVPLSKWAIRVQRFSVASPDTSAPGGVITLSDVTSSASETGNAGTGNESFSATSDIFVGCNADLSGQGSVNINSLLVFDSALSAADITTAATLLRTRAANWGVSV